MTRRLLAAASGALLALGSARAADSFDDILRHAGDASAEYLQPLADASTLLAGSGAFHGARSKGVAGLDAGVKLLVLPIASGDPEEFTILDATEAKTLGLPVLVVNKGLMKGWQVGARYMGLELSDEVGKLELMGASVRFEFNELFHVPLVMPRIGVQGDWSRLKVGESLTTTVTGLDLIVSKSFLVLEPYAGVSLLKGKAAFDYTYISAGDAQVTGHVARDVDSDVTRLAAGVNFTPFPLLRVNAEYALADYSTVTVGLLFNFF